MSTIEQNEETVEPAYIYRFKNTMTGSWGIFERAQKVIPGGISHFPRWHDPYPLYCDRARGSRMWDADVDTVIAAAAECAKEMVGAR